MSARSDLHEQAEAVSLAVHRVRQLVELLDEHAHGANLGDPAATTLGIIANLVDEAYDAANAMASAAAKAQHADSAAAPKALRVRAVQP